VCAPIVRSDCGSVGTVTSLAPLLVVASTRYGDPSRGTITSTSPLLVRAATVVGAVRKVSRTLPLDVEPSTREAARYRKDLLPVTYVVGEVAGGADSPLYGMFAMRDELARVPAPHGGAVDERFFSAPADPWRAWSIKWSGEWQVTWETFRDMGLAYGVGLVLIYLLAVAQFGSYVTPLVTGRSWTAP